MDRSCLEQGKRCVMWDDEGAGFYLVGAAPKPPLVPAPPPSPALGNWHLPATTSHPPALPSPCPAHHSLTLPSLLLPQMLNWDWLSNRPAQPGCPEEALQPGWWHNAKQLLRPPLLDPSLPEDQVAAWVDAHTMRVHAGFLHLLPKLRREVQTQRLVLDDSYWQQLQQLPAAQRQPAVPTGCSGSASAAAPATAAASAP